MDTPAPTQLAKFKEAARQLETDDDPECFREKLAGLVKHKPVEEKSMSSSQLDERREREFRERVATALNLATHQLDELDWDIAEHIGNDGELYGYNVSFSGPNDRESQKIIDRITHGQGWVRIGPVL